MTPPVLCSSQPAVRWDPFTEFEDLYDRMGQLMGALFDGPARQLGALAWSPLADVSETEDAYLIEADLPRGEARPGQRRGWRRATGDQQRGRQPRARGACCACYPSAGRFEYRTTLPADADPGQVLASLADGVLAVRVPKAETAKPRRIEV